MSAARRPPSASGIPPEGPLPAKLDGVDESTWLDVIHKMDEVYSQLVADEVALEEKNAELEQQQQFIFSLLSAMSDVLVACNDHGLIEETNAALCELVGRSDEELRGQPLATLLADAGSVERVRHVMETVAARQGAAVEVELRDGTEAELAVLADALRRDYALVPTGDTKFSRGMDAVHGQGALARLRAPAPPPGCSVQTLFEQSPL